MLDQAHQVLYIATRGRLGGVMEKNKRHVINKIAYFFFFSILAFQLGGCVGGSDSDSDDGGGGGGLLGGLIGGFVDRAKSFPDPYSKCDAPTDAVLKPNGYLVSEIQTNLGADDNIVLALKKLNLTPSKWCYDSFINSTWNNTHGWVCPADAGRWRYSLHGDICYRFYQKSKTLLDVIVEIGEIVVNVGYQFMVVVAELQQMMSEESIYNLEATFEHDDPLKDRNCEKFSEKNILATSCVQLNYVAKDVVLGTDNYALGSGVKRINFQANASGDTKVIYRLNLIDTPITIQKGTRIQYSLRTIKGNNVLVGVELEDHPGVFKYGASPNAVFLNHQEWKVYPTNRLSWMVPAKGGNSDTWVHQKNPRSGYNHLVMDLSDYSGKRIKDVLVLYHKSNATAKESEYAYIDDIKINYVRPGAVDIDYMDGKIMAGYQGWFSAKNDGSPLDGRWSHWVDGTLFDLDKATTDLWPYFSAKDVNHTPVMGRKISKVLLDTGLTKNNGTDAMVFSSFSEEIVDLHFKWMQENNIDGVFIQRFVSQLSSPALLEFMDEIVINCMKAALKYDRAIALLLPTSRMLHQCKVLTHIFIFQYQPSMVPL